MKDNRQRLAELIAAKDLLPLEAVDPDSGVRFWTDCDGFVHVAVPYGVMPREVASELEDRAYSAIDDALSDVGAAIAGGEGLKRDIRQAVRRIMADAGIKDAEVRNG